MFVVWSFLRLRTGQLECIWLSGSSSRKIAAWVKAKVPRPGGLHSMVDLISSERAAEVMQPEGKPPKDIPHA